MKKILVFILISNSIFAVTNTNTTNTVAPNLTNQQSSSNTPKTNSSLTPYNFLDGFGVGMNVGTLGVGIDVSHQIYKDYLGLRFNANYFHYNSDVQGNPYAINMNTYGLLLDYTPFENNFRVSGGLYYNNNSLTMQSASTLSLNGQTYNSNQFGNLSGGVSFTPISPYIGIGYGSKSAYTQDRKGFYFSGDIGILYSQPTLTINATCTAASGVDCASFNNNLNAERQNAQNSLNSYGQFYPVINLGFGYRF